MEKGYKCGISLNNITGLIKSLHLIDVKNKMRYNGFKKIGSSCHSIEGYNLSYDFYFDINNDLFNELIDISFKKEIYNKKLKDFIKKHKIEESII
jgi:hypothetical protein